jgi:hypothetical protein
LTHFEEPGIVLYFDCDGRRRLNERLAERWNG